MTRIDPDVLRARYVEIGEEWADKNAAATVLEKTEKVVLAELTLEAQGKSMAEREAIALTSAGYREHIRKMIEARRVANRAKVNLDAAEMWNEMARTKEATTRAEMNYR